MVDTTDDAPGGEAVTIRPESDLHSNAFWAGLRRRQVVVGRCLDCQRDFFPRLPTCPRCGGRRLVDETVSGAGTVYSWVRVHRALGDSSVVEPPYVVATIDLDDGCRMFGRIEPHQSAAIGLAVTPAFVDHDGWTELVFAPGSPE
ncbi:MAG TPA: OB-fold domain-containing protein [Acidimicrobiales bacterium]